jgi:hypothetical protein
MSERNIEDYLISLPERALRSAAALTGGTSLLLTKTLLPDFVRESTTYKVTIGDLQRFLITRIAQVEPASSSGIKPFSDDYLYHKMAGNVIELASFMAVRFSPVWAFAIVADVAGGSSEYFNRLVAQMKEDGIVDKDAEFENVHELLQAIQLATKNSSMAIDRPPLTQDELNRAVDGLRADYNQLAESGINLIPQVDRIQNQMEQVSEREGVTFDELSDVLTYQATKLGRSGAGTVLAIGKTTSIVFEERILGSYARTLEEINEAGLPNYLGESLEPYLNSAIGHLDPEKPTWTQTKLTQFRTKQQ